MKYYRLQLCIYCFQNIIKLYYYTMKIKLFFRKRQIFFFFKLVAFVTRSLLYNQPNEI